MDAPELDPAFWPQILSLLTSGESLLPDQATAALRAVMTKQVTEVQVAAFLMALRTKGETVDELEAFSNVVLEFATPVKTPGPAVDTCGTGGDRSGTFNISTVAAIVVAGAGQLVAKHGNRAATSQAGSADVLEALGVKIDLDAAGVERCLEDVGIGFMLAPAFHPAAAYAAGVRRELKVPTVFNFLGPLSNPAKPGAQVIGVYDGHMLPVMANVMARRGTKAWLVQSLDGLDELSTTMPSVVYYVADHAVHRRMFDPDEFGIAHAKSADLKGADANANAGILRAILDGEAGPPRDIVLVNAAAALVVADKAADIPEGMTMAAESIDSGKAKDVLAKWVEVSQAV